jgi:predicted SAM-dependent methyltransferase
MLWFDVEGLEMYSSQDWKYENFTSVESMTFFRRTSKQGHRF